MSAPTDKLKGAANAAIGAAKQGFGKAAGKPLVEAEGAGQKSKGKVQESIGDAKTAIKRTIDKS